MKKILFLSKSAESASTRYRALDYFGLLKDHDWEPVWLPITGSFSVKQQALGAAGSADVVVLVRRLLPAPLLWWLRKKSRHLIFDFDDAVFTRPSGDSRQRLRRFRRIVRLSDQVFAGNDFLAARARSENAEVHVIPTSLDVERYRVDVPRPVDHFDLVWIGSQSTRRYLEPLLPVLETCADSIPELRLKIVADFELESSKLTILNQPWSAGTEAAELASAHVGIAPMQDTPWTRGKCALKILQYMAAGLPVITSPAGVNREVIENGRNGYLADSPQDWQTAITALAADPRLGRRLGEQGRLDVQEKFDRARVFAKILARLKAATAGYVGVPGSGPRERIRT